MQSGLKEQLEQGQGLRHVETVDRAGAAIPSDAHVKKVDRAGFLAEVAAAGGQDRAGVTPAADRSAPRLEPGTTVQQVDRTAQMQAIKHGAAMREIGGQQQLEHVDSTDRRDASAPAIEPGTKLRPSARPDLMRELEATGGSADLRHTAPEEQRDASAPIIPVQITVHAPVSRTAVLRQVESKQQQ